MLTQTIDPEVGAKDSCGAAITLLILRAKPFLVRIRIVPEVNEAYAHGLFGSEVVRWRGKDTGILRRLTVAHFHITQKNRQVAKFV